MESVGVRTDRLGMLLDQFDKAREMAQVRLTGLTDEEYLWEPVPGCWSLRPGEGGRWQADFVHPEVRDRSGTRQQGALEYDRSGTPAEYGRAGTGQQNACCCVADHPQWKGR